MTAEAQVVVTNPTGLHARPAVKLAQLAARFDARVEIRAGDDGDWVRARSTARVMKLKAAAQSTIHLRAEGTQAEDALCALVELVRRDFDEGPATVAGKDAVAADESPAGAVGKSVVVDESPAGAAGKSVVVDEGPAGAAGNGGRSDGVPDYAAAADEGPAGATTKSVVVDEGPAGAAGNGAAGSDEPARDTGPNDPAVTEVVAGEALGSRAVSAVIASPGLAIGTLHRLASSASSSSPGSSGSSGSSGAPTERRARDTGAERAALDEAVAWTMDTLRALAEGSGGLARDVLGFQISLLEDQEFLEPVWAEIAAGVATERAWAHHLAREIADYESAPTDYLRDRAADLRDLRERVAMVLAGDSRQDPQRDAQRDTKRDPQRGPRRDVLPEQCVVIADELTPSRFLELDRSRAVAVATRTGSPASHVAMLARAHGVPMLVQLACAPEDLVPGTEAIVDADRGCLVPAPPLVMRERYALRIEERHSREREVRRQASWPARTRSGTPVRVLLNVDDPADLSGLDPSHCDGIGLTRTELLFHRAAGLPDEQTQLDCYRRLVAWACGRPVTVRTLDAGGDKPIPGLTIEGESNPFLGLRGLRLSLSRPEVFATQLRALARAATSGELKVMVPMVTTPGELEEARRCLTAQVEALRAAGIEAATPRLGMMVEIPAAALTIDTFDADFYSIGSNDLAQYVLAAGRDSSAVASLLDPLHPAVLELIARVADTCARTGREVSVCGEMAAQPECLRALLDAGIRVLSVPPAALASTKAALATL